MKQFFYINFIIVAILLVMSSCDEEIDPNDKPCASVAFAVGDSLQTRMLYGSLGIHVSSESKVYEFPIGEAYFDFSQDRVLGIKEVDVHSNRISKDPGDYYIESLECYATDTVISSQLYQVGIELKKCQGVLKPSFKMFERDGVVYARMKMPENRHSHIHQFRINIIRDGGHNNWLYLIQAPK